MISQKEKNKDLKAVFWDVDGTLADTELYGHRKAFNLAFKEYNLNWDWDIEIYKKLLNIAGGKKRIIHYANSISQNIDMNLALKIHKAKQSHYKQLILKGIIPLRIGVSRLIKELSYYNVDQWIVTTSGEEALYNLLNNFFPNNTSPFKGQITFEDIENHKPNPEAYLEALKRSNKKSDNVIAIEDSLIGLKSAKGAALSCLITISPWNNNKFADFSLADAVVENLGDQNNQCNLKKGPLCKNNIVNINYLHQILNN